ncbi:MAG TPA: flagellar biosynthesis protein FlhA [Burkholderiales bacterium]|nr:flagellar biosynthesis protein FlhA [Burkholderiales bacterium]
MNPATAALQGFSDPRNLRTLAAPALIVMIMAMMVLPLPPLLLDVLFTFNIAVSIIVMLVGLNTLRPLDFAVFPTVLLVTTLLRLSLNVASTRVVLLEGHTGPDAAGKVIEAFGHFLVGGNYTVGIVVFVILVIINFVVITRGSGRIAEVSARFTLDAMPGKQMAIDADLNAGLIGEEEARKRRREIAREADFYGAMDGASKFVRGDAIAGILVMLINIVGGLVVGVLQHDMELSAAARNYTLLTIGDGLVAQVPALIISTAAGIVISRVGADEDIGQQLVQQLFARPQALAVTAGILGVMGLIPGMPHLAFLAIAAALAGGAYALARRAQAARVAPVPPVAPQALEARDASWDDVAPVDVLGLEVGYRLIPLVDKGQDGELLRRIKGIRKKFAQDIGFLPPAVHIRDNLELRPNAYRITLKGVEIGAGEAHPGMFLAINPGRVAGTLPGTATHDPAFGLPAIWVETAQRDQAQTLGYTVADASTVVATHFSHLIHRHAAEILGRQEVQQLLDHIGKETPKLVEDLVPKTVSLAVLHRVLQNLLEEGVPIRDMRSVIETVAENAPRSADPAELVAMVRVSLARSIVQQSFPSGAEMQVIALNPDLERLLGQALPATGSAGLEPGLAETLGREAARLADAQEKLGLPPVLLVPGSMRAALSRILRRSVPQLKVIAHSEVPDSKRIKVSATLGGKPS